MKRNGDPDQFDPHGYVAFQQARRRELRAWAEGDPTAEPPATGIAGFGYTPGRGTSAWTNRHLNLTRSLADVDQGRA